jgi:hypothetical protein
MRAQQFSPDTAVARLATTRTIQAWHDFIGAQAPLYNGIEHIMYPRMTGHPYFDQEGMQYGSIVYEGILYRNIPMLYDLVRDQPIVFNREGYMLGLSREKVKEFSLSGHRFIHTPSGFYDLLCSGTITILAKRTKSI